MNAAIRALDYADVPPVTTIYREASTARQPDEIDEVGTREMMRAAIDTGIALAAIEDDRLVGFVLAPRHPVRRLSHVITNVLVCLEPSARGRGIGRQLMAEMMARATKTTWCERIEFFVRSSSARASRPTTAEGRTICRWPGSSRGGATPETRAPPATHPRATLRGRASCTSRAAPETTVHHDARRT
jgi:L-amino acid N-acyltransferase YncA